MAKRGGRTVIVTSFGTDGACAAAMALLHMPEADVCVTSMSRVATTLEELANHAGAGDRIDICGVGVGSEPQVTLHALESLSGAGADVTWYCGRGYLAEYAKDLAARCTAVLKDCGSNTEAVLRHLAMPKSKTATMLLELAQEYVAQTDDVPESHTWWQDFVQASTKRFFAFCDEKAFPACIRRLAGLEDVTAADRAEVAAYRNSETKSVPLGNSRVMKKVRTSIAQLGPINEPVLILGPSGAGKEMVARFLHEASQRRGKPFLPINCAVFATNPDLALDKLFGHKAGSYTGAKTDAKGAFETADEGTLFLDELGELPLEVQTQLLRVLEEGLVTPVGTLESVRVNVRIIAATNRNLVEMVNAGTFRLDLYYRLNVLMIDVPPLCERREDMKSIANAVIHDLKQKGFALKMDERDWETIDRYPWPGNIRQFINILKRAAYLKTSVAESLAQEIRRGTPHAGDVGAGAVFPAFWPKEQDAIVPEAEIRRAYMKQCFDLCGGNWALASRKLNVAINTLRAWLEPDA